ncbi:MAG: amidohydrolase family protein [Acidobacteria bacterium]|nr:amidohydrolase family protein [Acidobacteriota bacterium]
MGIGMWLLAAALLLDGVALAAAPVKLVQAGRLVDVRSGKVLEDAGILIDGDRVSAVASFDTLARREPSAESIDLRGYTVLPGFIDTHTHLTNFAFGWRPELELVRSASKTALESIPNARATLQAGFTTVRDCGTYRAFVDVALRDAINAGTIEGPRMSVCGAYVTISGGGGEINATGPDIALPEDLRYGVADGPDAVRKRVRLIVRNGVDFVKVIASGAFLTIGSEPSAREMSREEIRAAVEEARNAGLRVAAHAHAASSIVDAIEAGAASIEHGSFIDDTGIRLLKDRHVYLSTDLYDWDFTIENADKLGWPAEYLEKTRRYYARAEACLKKAFAAGAPVVYGTDAAVYPHGDNARQFAYMVRYGLTPLEAIRSATINAADLLGWSDRVGTIEPGLFADLVVVSGDPLVDVKTLEHPVMVIKGGRVVLDRRAVSH